MTRIVVLGAGGQIGRALVRQLGSRAVAFTREQADFSNPEKLIATLAATECDAVINAAAYTQVDKAESERELAFRVNAEAVSALAQHCATRGIPFVHYSTDYVFDGSGDAPWREEDATAPLNVYGESKLAGEHAVEAASGQHLILRTSWVYDGEGKNFLNTMLRLGAEREELRVVADQFGAPSYAGHLAQATLQALDAALAKSEFPSGVYHMCNRGVASWHGFTEQIFASARKQGFPLVVRAVQPIATSDYPTPARRPHNSRLDCSRLAHILGVTLPFWEEGLTAALEEKRESHRMSD